MIAKSKRKRLLEKCGLPDIDETKHCFADSTHHTCCKLSRKTRKYADKTGNPIGKISEKVYEIQHKKPAGEYTTWCTCTGSKVCSYYNTISNGKTYIKFINSTKSKDEDVGIQTLKLMKHKTPGVE
jgi:hypothetical protein